MVKWNSEADAKLLFAILKTAKPKIDHDAVANYMGEGVSAYAVQHRLRKLNALAQGKGSEPNTPTSKTKSGNSESTPRATPQKPTGSTAGKKRPAEEDHENSQLGTKNQLTKKLKEAKEEADGEVF